MFRFGHMGYMPWGGSFMMIIWVVLIGAVIYFLVQNSKNNHNSYDDKRDNYRSQQYKEDQYIESRKNGRAEEIARERYADGEISREELEEILRTLRNN